MTLFVMNFDIHISSAAETGVQVSVFFRVGTHAFNAFKKFDISLLLI